jgi:hypothetical protein
LAASIAEMLGMARREMLQAMVLNGGAVITK